MCGYNREMAADSTGVFISFQMVFIHIQHTSKGV